jgi:hypothetical protein
MAEAPDPRLFPYADHVLARLDAEREPAAALKDAIASKQALELDFHPHADDSGWCAAVSVAGEAHALIHLRGIVKRREECAAMGRVLAGLMLQRYRLADRPRVVIDGAELYA